MRLVFARAAGDMAPLLVERVADDLTNRIAFGALGALFLRRLPSLGISGEERALFIAPGALALAAVCFSKLRLFGENVARRVTVDVEIAASADGLGRELARHRRQSERPGAAALIRPDGPDVELGAPAPLWMSPQGSATG